MTLNKLAHGQIKFRPVEPEDLDIIYRWENDPEIWQVSNTLVPFSRYILKQYIAESHRDIFETKQLRLIIETMDQTPVGAIDLFDFEPFHRRAGIGILIHNKKDQSKGLATDALHLMASYATEVLGIHQLYANITVDNKASIHLFEKVGFKCAGDKKDWIRTSEGWIDEALYQLILK